MDFIAKREKSMRVHVIINPVSSGGKTGARQWKILSALERKLGSAYSLCVTGEPLEACFSARQAILDGSKLIVSIGGDGTIQEIINGFFSNGNLVNPSCQLGIIDSGTGHGFSQSLGLPTGFEEQLEVIQRGKTRPIDLGKIVFSDESGRTREHYFMNECQAGIGGEVVRRVQSKHKRLGGFIAFGAVTLLTALRYPNQSMTVEIDGMAGITERFIGVVIGNGNYMAGGMNLIPHAQVDDGLFDILLMHEQSIPQRLWNFPKIYSGRHLASPRFTLHRGKKVTLSSSEKVTFEADGEFLGSLPCSIEILPSALQVRLNIPEKK
jgi:YegS/Rv2252/BmrU family lipid kinase